MNQIQIHDNFLDTSDFQKIYENMMGDQFPWYYNTTINTPCLHQSELNYQFTYSFYVENAGVIGNYYGILLPCLEKMGIRFLLRCKSNLNPKTEVNRQIGDMHCDYDLRYSKTAIYYVNTNNGFTLFEDGTKVDSVSNRLVVFDTLTNHVGYTCTDENVRVLINFNYIPV